MKLSTMILTKAYQNTNKGVNLITGEKIPENIVVTLDNMRNNKFPIYVEKVILEILEYLDKGKLICL